MAPEKEVLETYNRLKTALCENNTVALEKLYAEDYRGIDNRGQPHDRKLILNAYGKGGVTLEKFEEEDLLVQVIDSVGIVTGKGFVRGRYGKETFEHDLRFCDIYVRRHDVWQIIYAQATELEKA